MKKMSLFLKRHFSKEAVFLGIIIIILLHPIFLHHYSDVFPKNDVAIYSAWRTFWVDSFRQLGHIPLWNPYLFGGNPFIGNMQVGFFYPINLIYFIFPIAGIIGNVFLLDFLLAGIFTYAYARLIGINKLGSLISGICFAFNGAVMKQLFLGHIILMDSLAWFPLLMFLYEKIIQTRNLKHVLLSGVVLALMILAGTTQLAVYAIFAAALYFLIRLIQEYGAYSRRTILTCFIPAITIIIGLSLSAVQLLPTLELSGLSIRNHGVSYDFASAFSFHPKQLPLMIFPSLFGSDINNSFWGIGSFWGSSIYIGIIPFLLIITAIIYRRNKHMFALLIISLAAVAYALGKYGPIFKIAYQYVPFLNDFRVPTRSLFIYAFSCGIFAGFGGEFIIKKINSGSKAFFSRVFKIISSLFVLGSVTYVILYLKRNDISFFEKIMLKNSYAQGINHHLIYSLILNDIFVFCVFLFLTLCLLLLIIFKKTNTKFSVILLVLLIVADYFLFYSNFFNYYGKQTKSHQFLQEFALIKKDSSRYRVFNVKNGFEEQTAGNKLENITGNDPLTLSSYRNFLLEIGSHENMPYENWVFINRIENTNNLKLLNVKYVISDKKIELTDFSQIFKGENYVYQIKDFIPRAFLIYTKSPNFSLSDVSSAGKAEITKYEPDKISLKTTLNQNGYLVLSEIYYPGWKAYDNNRKTEIIVSNKIFRSIQLNKGEHNIMFVFEPQSYMIGKIITITSLFFLFFIFLFLNFYYSRRTLKKKPQ